MYEEGVKTGELRGEDCEKKCARVFNNTAAPTPPQCPDLATSEHTYIYDNM